MTNPASDAVSWIASGYFDEDGVVLHFHHRIVQIHPFANGNGRLGRVAADLLTSALGPPALTWGRNLQVSTEELRARYLAALRFASLRRADVDPDDLSDLRYFARR